MNILNVIAQYKRAEVEAICRRVPLDLLKAHVEASPKPGKSLSQSILSHPVGIIAEFKRRSPSKGDIAPQASVIETVKLYAANGAAGCSVLTDIRFFGGSPADLALARSVVDIPLLRKEFIVDPYQIYEAAAIGADAILLIASILTPAEVADFTDLAHRLGLEVLLELHNPAELGHIHPEVDMVGINNRDLTDFSVDMAASMSLAERLPQSAVRIAESGIRSATDIVRLRSAGFQGFLIGEAIVATPSPGQTLSTLIKDALRS